MNSTKAISLLTMQLDKIDSINTNSYSAWQTQTISYIKGIFGEQSEEYAFVKKYKFVWAYSDTSFNQQIKQNTPQIKSFLENCIESIEHRGLTKNKTDPKDNKESWTKKYPVIWEIVKAIIILLVGYFFRVITEPK
ncbi:MAG: hypothetical protein LC109_10055 [Bacteroidia bacterium]|nr:hypothetical protein [Bacteroidia bacterium]